MKTFFYFLSILSFVYPLYAQPLSETDQAVESEIEAGEKVIDIVVEVDSAETVSEPEVLPTFLSKEEEITALRALNDSIVSREEQRDALFRRMEAAIDPIQREQMVPELEELTKKITELKRNFQKMVVRTADTSIFETKVKKEFNWQTELGQIIEPLLAEIKDATKDSRELGEINIQLELGQERLAASEASLKSIAPLLEEASDPELVERLERLKDLWETRKQDAQNQIALAELQLKEREENKEPAIEQAQQAASDFLKSSGLNLLLGILVLGAVFLGMGAIQRAWSRFRPTRKKGRSFSTRLSSLVWSILTVLLAVGGMIGTFNAQGDILLVSISVLFLFGVGWAAMKTLPGMIDQFRMMLNMGAVREDERLIYEGLPWKVNAISFRTELLNPLLNGGTLTLPTRMLAGMLSRPPGPDEEWFPSKKDDWVLLSDGTFGKVSYQTPSSVQIVPPGGSQKVYNTLQYMDLSPMVLSTGFRREIFFGIDYQLISDATTRIPQAMEKYLQEVLEKRLGENLNHLEVQLAEAGDSALKLCVLVDCKGDAASQWPYIPMWVHTALVDLCNQNGWGIPFPQLQIHTDSK